SGAQRRRSWYIFFFQLPLLPELFLKQRKTMEIVFKTHKPGAIPESEVRYYSDAAREPNAARAMINYYRAAKYPSSRLPKITVPTLVVWGEQDVALGTELLGDLDRYLENFRIERLPNASHWVLEDEPEAAHAAIATFLKSKPS
ncbi:MAG TPA: alpha/beta hydrolase, partial [Polyangiaceae bacterium]